MPRIRTLITRVEIDEARRAHDCQRNSAHRITQGEKRLKVRNGRGWDHYCMKCARMIIDKDISKLQDLLRVVGD
jgi:hypothetical protein